jgi:hypothetical protein
MNFPGSRFTRYLTVCLLLCAFVVGMTWSAIGRHDEALAQHRSALDHCLAQTAVPTVTQGSACSEDPRLLDLAQQVNEADEEASQWVGMSSVLLVILLALIMARLAVFTVNSLRHRD